MGWRHSELVAFGPEIVPLSDADALTAFRHAWDCSSQSRYGLSETAFADIERLDVEDPGPEARRWLAERVGGGKLLVVFGRDEVFQMPAPLFLDRWQDMFCPSRDDVVIFPAAGGWRCSTATRTSSSSRGVALTPNQALQQTAGAGRLSQTCSSLGPRRC